MRRGIGKEYLVLADRRFARQAARELLEMFPKAQIKESIVHDCLSVITAGIGSDNAELNLFSKMPIFIDFAMPIDARLGKFAGDYGEITKAIAKEISKEKGRPFKLEAKKIGTKLDMNAKAIEVLLGRSLEALGYRADLKNPKTVVYIVFLRGEVLIGHTDSPGGTLDTVRFENKCRDADSVNRAEFKIKEAVKYFGIDLKKAKTCLDIGAAPGGWTHYLSQHGIKVVAIDGALLDYGKLSKDRKLMIIIEKEKTDSIKKQISKYKNAKVGDAYEKGMLDDYDVIHLKTGALNGKALDALGSMGKFGMLTIDTNTSPSESADIANSLAKFLKRGATLVMTVKLITKSVDSHIAAVNEKLSKCYGHIILKKLPHNREELTLCAERK